LGVILKNFNNRSALQNISIEPRMRGHLKKALVITLLVILTVSTLCAVAFAPKAKADPTDVKILSYSWYVYPDTSYGYGDFIVVGEIQNQGTSILDHVAIQGIAYNSTGPVADSGCTAYVEDMLPDQKAPFYMDFTYQNSYSGDMTWDTMVDHVELNVVYANATTVQMNPGLVVAGNTSFPDPSQNGLYTVTGIIRNAGNQIAGKLWVVTTFYNASGTAVAVNYTNYLVQDSLPSQGTVSFQATPMDHTQLTSEITSYSLLIQSKDPVASTTATPAPSETTTAAPTPLTSSSSQPEQSSSPQQSDISPDLTYAIVGAVVIVVVIVAMLFIRKRRK
jgi:hypothetical protein